ncbi:reverse transcriptase domain-containing protein [Tanacetum coccineum]
MSTPILIPAQSIANMAFSEAILANIPLQFQFRPNHHHEVALDLHEQVETLVAFVSSLLHLSSKARALMPTNIDWSSTYWFKSKAGCSFGSAIRRRLLALTSFFLQIFSSVVEGHMSFSMLCYGLFLVFVTGIDGFEATNNEAEYEALIAGLRITEKIGVQNLEVNVDSKLVANQVNGIYIAKETDMIKYLEKVKALSSTFRAFSIKQVLRSKNKKADALSKMASTSFAHLSKQVLVEELKEKPMNKREVLAVVEEEGDT